MRTKPFNYEEYLKGAKAVSRDGRKVKEILKFTTESTYQLVVLFENSQLVRVHEDGSAFSSDDISSKDILLVVEPISIWVNVYLTNGGIIINDTDYNSKEDAKKHGSRFPTYLKTIEITDEP